MAVNLRAALGARYDASALAAARRAADALGYRLVRVDEPDERLAAWIDWQFAPSWWSSEACAGSAWYAERDGEIAGFAAFGALELPFPWLRAYRGSRETGIFGPYGVAATHRGGGIGALLLEAALCSLAETYATALIPAVGDPRLVAMYERRTGAQVCDEFGYDVPQARAVILASGNGTNAQNVIDRVRRSELALDLAAVIANDPAAAVLQRARHAAIPAVALAWERKSEARAAYDARLLAATAGFAPDLVLLLGWMHLLPAAFLERFGETLNVHPAFLPFDPARDDVVMPDGSRIPAFRGARAPEATIAAGARWGGATVHRVTVATDRGAVLVRTPFQLAPGATLDDFSAAVRPCEHAAVASAIRRWGFERAAG